MFSKNNYRYKLSRPIRIVLATHIWVATHDLRNAGIEYILIMLKVRNLFDTQNKL